jgi:hypothetical protein
MRLAIRIVRLWVVLGVLASVIAGCGGGGGGGGNASGSTGVFTYFTTFPAGGASESEVVTLSIGTTVEARKVVNSASSASNPQTLNFTGLANGTYFVSAILYNARNGAGSAIGSAQQVIDSSSPTTMSTEFGGTVASVTVSPATASVSVGQTVAFAAQAYDSQGVQILETAAPTWAITSGNSTIANINSSGVVTGVAAGSATVQAVYGAISGTSALTVNSSVNPQGTWTIMLFLNASNDLDYYSYGSTANQIVGNVPQIETIAQTPTSATKFVMQWKLSPTVGADVSNHPFNSTRRYLAVSNPSATPKTVLNGLDLIQDLGQGVDMGSPTTLTSFVQWAEKTYPAQHYMLIMWDHGNGWESVNPDVVKKPTMRAISQDQETNDIIDVWQLGPALANTNLDIISFDACLMQGLEVENEVASDAHYMVCSEDNVPGYGYPYNTAFSSFFTTPTAPITTLMDDIVNADIAYYPSNPETGPVSQSVVDLTKVSTVVSALNTFSQALISTGSSIGPTVQSIQNNSIPYDSADGYFYYDIGSITQRFVNATSGGVKTAAAALLAAEQAAVVDSKQSGLSPDSTGISIEFGTQPEFSPISADYSNLKIASQTSWPSFLNSSSLNP